MRSVCSIGGCTSLARARGWCGKHYQRWKISGDPNKVAWIRNDPETNFWAKVDRRGPDECWPWLAYRDADGYGHFGVWNGVKQVDIVAHRYAYETKVGPIGPGLHLDHICHTRAPECPCGNACPHRRCVNPAHVEPVSPAENIHRAPISPGQRHAARQEVRTHCKNGHPRTPGNTRLATDGGRTYTRCTVCERRPRPHRRKQTS